MDLLPRGRRIDIMSKATIKNAKDKSLQEAKTAIEKEKQERISKCQQEMSAILKKYNCQIIPSMIITQQGNIPQIQIVAEDKN